MNVSDTDRWGNSEPATPAVPHFSQANVVELDCVNNKLKGQQEETLAFYIEDPFKTVFLHEYLSHWPHGCANFGILF